MARPRKDKFVETTINFEEGTEFELVDVSVPSYCKITYKIPISKDSNGKSLYGTTETILKKSISDKQIKKEYQEKGMIIIKIEQATIRFRNFCEKCKRNGNPIIERKSNKYDYHAREIAPLTEDPKHRIEVNRPDEYWLIYHHKTAPKKCRIMQFDINNFVFKSSKNNIREIYKHIFPQCIEWAKKESHFFSSFQKFLNVLHP